MTCEPSATNDIMDGHKSSVYALKHHPNDIWNFISAGWDDTVQFWDRREGRSNRKIFGPHICGQAIDIDPIQIIFEDHISLLGFNGVTVVLFVFGHEFLPFRSIFFFTQKASPHTSHDGQKYSNHSHSLVIFYTDSINLPFF